MRKSVLKPVAYTHQTPTQQMSISITMPTNTHLPTNITIQQSPPIRPWHKTKKGLVQLVGPSPQSKSIGCTAYLDDDEADSESDTQATSTPKTPPWQVEQETKTRAIMDRVPATSDSESVVTPKGSVAKEVKPYERRRIRSDESSDSGSKTSGAQQEDILPPLTTPIRHGTHSRLT